jgi:hypothetical protein
MRKALLTFQSDSSEADKHPEAAFWLSVEVLAPEDDRLTCKLWLTVSGPVPEKLLGEFETMLEVGDVPLFRHYLAIRDDKRLFQTIARRSFLYLSAYEASSEAAPKIIQATFDLVCETFSTSLTVRSEKGLGFLIHHTDIADEIGMEKAAKFGHRDDED